MTIQQKLIWGAKSTPVVSAFRRTVIRRTLIVTFTLAIALLPGKALWAQPHARLSPSLQKHVASKSTAAVDVIVHGTANEQKLLQNN
jgi:hypothetical protein